MKLREHVELLRALVEASKVPNYKKGLATLDKMAQSKKQAQVVKDFGAPFFKAKHAGKCGCGNPQHEIWPSSGSTDGSEVVKWQGKYWLLSCAQATLNKQQGKAKCPGCGDTSTVDAHGLCPKCAGDFAKMFPTWPTCGHCGAELSGRVLNDGSAKCDACKQPHGQSLGEDKK